MFFIIIGKHHRSIPYINIFLIIILFYYTGGCLMHARDNPRQLYVSNKEGALMRLLRTGVVRMGDEARRRKKMISH